jgi:hypothetical protein
MDMRYRILLDDELPELYERIMADGLMWTLCPEYGDDMSKAEFLRLYRRDDCLVLGGFIEGELAGFMVTWPYRRITQCAEIGLCAFRKWFGMAPRLCVGALIWAFDHLDMVSMVGHVPAPNRHVLAMLEQVGFGKRCKIPGLLWYARKNGFVDGWLVMADRVGVETAKSILEV